MLLTLLNDLCCLHPKLPPFTACPDSYLFLHWSVCCLEALRSCWLNCPLSASPPAVPLWPRPWPLTWPRCRWVLCPFYRPTLVAFLWLTGASLLPLSPRCAAYHSPVSCFKPSSLCPWKFTPKQRYVWVCIWTILFLVPSRWNLSCDSA